MGTENLELYVALVSFLPELGRNQLSKTTNHLHTGSEPWLKGVSVHLNSNGLRIIILLKGLSTNMQEKILPICPNLELIGTCHMHSLAGYGLRKESS